MNNHSVRFYARDQRSTRTRGRSDTRLALAALFIFGVVGCARAATVAAAPDAALPLTSGRASKHRIVLAADAPGSVKLAAEEFKQYVRKATGADLPVVAVAADAREADGPVIGLGDTGAARRAGIAVADLPVEGFRIAARGGSLYIVGPDTADGTTTPAGGTSTGTLNGVYAFLEDHVGVRWLTPGPDGEDVPKVEALTVPADLDRTGAPAFASRRLPYVGSGDQALEWSRRMRVGGSLKVTHSHNWQETVPPALFAEHPDWFAEANGVRVPPVGRYKLETTNPRLVEFFAAKAVAAFKAQPSLACFSLSPSDSDAWSQSKESKALYEADPDGKRSVTRLVLTFYNDVARLVRKEVPDRMVAGYVYASYLYPPQGDVGGPLEPNLFLVCAPSPDYGFRLYRPDVQKTFEQVMGGWSQRTGRLGYYDLPTNLVASDGMPTATGVEILQFVFPRLQQYGVKHVYVSGVGSWGSGGLGNYLKAKLMWDPTADVRALARDYLDRAYGPKAGPVMAELHEALDAATARHYRADPKASYTMNPAVLRGVYADAYPKLEALLLKAKAAATEPAHATRLAAYETAMLLLNANLRRGGFLADAGRSPLYRTDEQVETLRADPSTGIPAAGGPRDAGGAGAVLKVRLADPQPAGPADPPKPTPFLLRGPTRTLMHVERDEEVRVVFADVPKSPQVVRYVVRDSLGGLVTSGVVQAKAVATFAGRQGQTYAMDVTGGSAGYAFGVTGCRYAVRDAGREPHALRLVARTTPLYLYVPPGTAAKAVVVTLSSASPGETAAADVLSPSGRVAGPLDTSGQPAVQLVLPAEPGADEIEGGFWTVRFKPPARGAVDDVHVDVAGPAGRWLGLDPERLLAVEPGGE
jgi:hypothetical protein